MTGDCHVRICERLGVRLPEATRLRTVAFAEAWCRISSYLSSMAALGYNPLVAIQIALAENAADMIGMHHTQSSATKG